jgi:hypothetical protein
MPLTDEQLEKIVPELGAAYLHLSGATELLAYLYHELRKSEKVPAMVMVGKLVRELEKMRRGLRHDDESILSRLMEGNTNCDLLDIDAARKRCREMFMRDLTGRTRTRKVSAQTDATSAPKKKRKSLVKSKKVLRFEGGKSHPPRDKKT